MYNIKSHFITRAFAFSENYIITLAKQAVTISKQYTLTQRGTPFLLVMGII
jgi:hypothetical protein